MCVRVLKVWGVDWGSYYAKDVWSKFGMTLASSVWACAFYEPFRDGLVLGIIVGVSDVCWCVVSSMFVGLECLSDEVYCFVVACYSKSF